MNWPYTMFPFIRFTNWKQEIEAESRGEGAAELFPFIRFTNWKQGFPTLKRWLMAFWVSIHTLHELEARPTTYYVIHNHRCVSIHTLHELEASSSSPNQANWCGAKGFHSYASRIGSKIRLMLLPYIVAFCFHSYASRIGSKTPRGVAGGLV